LANIFLNSCTLSTSQQIGKQAFIRIIDQISDEEMIVLKVLYESNQKQEILISLEDISSILGWDYIDTQVISGGLTQLGLVWNPMSSGWQSPETFLNQLTSLRLSSLGAMCMKICPTRIRPKCCFKY
jgi:hypothetical protein